ncbi:hypothetical protein B0H14DRAFT_2918691 [Mycena olivaceomarginata]|nr:hypothetical protein B0H14DRAFT_2918691 [Mycena olivaceomarginata]
MLPRGKNSSRHSLGPDLFSAFIQGPVPPSHPVLLPGIPTSSGSSGFHKKRVIQCADHRVLALHSHSVNNVATMPPLPSCTIHTVKVSPSPAFTSVSADFPFVAGGEHSQVSVGTGWYKPVNAAARGRAWQTLLVLICVRIHFFRVFLTSEPNPRRAPRPSASNPLSRRSKTKVAVIPNPLLMLYATSDHRICRDMPRTLYSSCLPLRGGRRSRDTIQSHIAALAPPALTPSNTMTASPRKRPRPCCAHTTCIHLYSTGTSFFLGKYSNGAVALHLHSHYTGDDVVHSHNYPYTFSRYTARSPEPVS